MNGRNADAFFIAGDVCPTPINIDNFCSGDAKTLISEEILGLLTGSVGLVFNLETALADSRTPIVKSGPCLIAPESSVRALANMNPICACMANNHITDSGAKGYERTVATLDVAGISHCGAGCDIQEASKPHVFEFAGKSYGIYACAEHEFTICGNGKPGANPFDTNRTYRDIDNLAKSVDYVIVLYHGMKEHYRYPSPEVRNRCRQMVEAGASLVCCQHSHCIGCMEEWKSGSILYGQGNFCFVKEGANEMWRTGLLVSVSSEGDIDFLPTRMNEVGTCLLEGEEAEAVIEGFRMRSREIQQPGFVESSWAEFCSSIADGYAIQLLDAVEPRWLSYLVKGLRKLHISKPRLAKGVRSTGFLNMLQCEAHNEVLRTYLEDGLDG